ncbi:MAG: hypothetical protein KCHDKBKB_01750 [Elusimicrobia bacterium]|nr:hypothetical protein [Elusimicrobiota bacterium]
MQSKRNRGTAAVELALLTPLLSLLIVFFVLLGHLFLSQLQLEHQAAQLARRLAMDMDSEPFQTGSPVAPVEVVSTVEIRDLPTLPRGFPLHNRPLRVFSVTLIRSFYNAVTLTAHAREVCL